MSQVKSSHHNNSLKNKGFTLIELVVVIVILGILAATAAPKFMNLTKDAKIANLKSMYGSLTSAFKMVHAKSIIQGKDKEWDYICLDHEEKNIDECNNKVSVYNGYPNITQYGLEAFDAIIPGISEDYQIYCLGPGEWNLIGFKTDKKFSYSEAISGNVCGVTYNTASQTLTLYTDGC